MGQLSGFTYRDIVQRLKFFGFSFLRQAAGSHEIWYNKSTGRYISEEERGRQHKMQGDENIFSGEFLPRNPAGGVGR